MPAPYALPALPALMVQLTEDSEPLKVQTIQRDMLRWEETAHKHKWPATSEAPFLTSWFMGWAALDRMGKLPPELRRWEDFRNGAFGVGPAPADDDPESDAVPTAAVPGNA